MNHFVCVAMWVVCGRLTHLRLKRVLWGNRGVYRAVALLHPATPAPELIISLLLWRISREEHLRFEVVNAMLTDPVTEVRHLYQYPINMQSS